MGSTTGISWTDSTWNPIRGCSRVSTGCVNCYAETVAARFSGPGQPYEGLAKQTSAGPRWTGEVRFVEKHLLDPLQWSRPRKIFVNSMSDLFHEKLPDADLDAIFAVMALARGHTFQVLTKRPERMAEYFRRLESERVWSARWRAAAAERIKPLASVTVRRRVHEALGEAWLYPLPNVWLGVSTEDQETAESRIPILLSVKAFVHWISAEPLLGPIDVTSFLWGRSGSCASCPGDADCECGYRTRKENGQPSLDWVVVGGESGVTHRPMNDWWAESLLDQCRQAGVAFFYKQKGGRTPAEGGCSLRGVEIKEFPL